MKITEQQIAALESLTCERLSSNVSNLREIEAFDNNRNENLVYALKNQAFTEDEENSIAYYLVKDENGDILFYFSLKCGSLYDNYFNTEVFNLLKKLYSDLLERERAILQKDDEDIDVINELLEKLRSRKGIAKVDLERIKRKTKGTEDFENILSEDMDKVGATFAGIELVHFCSNTDKVWKCPDSHQKIGAIVFWYFIVPKVLAVMKLVGCEFLFLFAADFTEDEELVNYYKTAMSFSEPQGKKTLMPLYDLSCKLLYQETSELERKRADFFNNFNPDEGAV